MTTFNTTDESAILPVVGSMTHLTCLNLHDLRGRFPLEVLNLSHLTCLALSCLDYEVEDDYLKGYPIFYFLDK